jgi:phage/plasmid-like protein (TIGR03299 family)
MEQRITDILNQTGLNWKVRQEGIQTSSGIILPDHRAIVREDTNDVLSVRSDSYHPYQNDQLIELLDKVSNQTGYEIHRGGSFKNGARVFVQLKSNDLRLGNDRIEGFLTGINSFDGSTSLAFGPSNVTISCQNSFFASFRQIDTKIRHTSGMQIKIDDICRRLDGAVEEERVMFNHIVELSETRFDDIIKDRVVRTLFDVKPEINLRDSEALSPRKFNQITKFYVDLNGELQQKGDNMWGLFSGVTKYTTHSVSARDNTENKMFGVYGNREKEIFRDLVELV